MPTILSHNELNDLDKLRTRLAKDEKLRIQFSNPSEYTSRRLRSINDLAREFPEQITIRFWSHIGDSFDFKTLDQLPDIRKLWLDPIRARNWEHFKSLPNLRSLSFGILEIDDKKILSHIIHQNLRSLTLTQMRTKALDLQYLEQGENLQELRLFGHRKNISSISTLQSLRALIFSPSIQDTYPYISQLPNLEHLEFQLGGSETVNEIFSTSLKTLNFIQVKHLQHLGNLSRFPNLEKIKVENQPLLVKTHYTQ